MRRLGLGSSLLGMLCLAWPAAPARAFEGTVKWRLVRVERAALAKVVGEDADAEKVFAVPYDTLMSMHGQATVSDVTIYAKGNKIRAEGTARSEKTYTITDLGTGNSVVVDPTAKKVVDIKEEDLQAIQRRAASTRAFFEERQKADQNADPRDTAQRLMKGEPPASPPTFELVSLDKQQTISGMPTRAFEVRGGGGDPVLGWVTSEHADLLELLRQFDKVRERQSARGAIRPKTALLREGLPVRVQMLDARAYTVEDLVLVEAKDVDDALFQVPADYSRQTVMQQADHAGSLKPPKPSKK